MQIESVYKSRPFLFETQKDDVGGGEEIVSYLIETAGIKEYDYIQFLCSNYEYDSYVVVANNVGYCVKYSFDENNVSLKKEFDILKNCYPISAKAFVCEKIKFGDWMHYSIISFEFADNVKDYGLASLINNWSSFFNIYEKIESKSCHYIFTDYLNDFYQNCDWKNFPEDSREAIQDYYSLDTLDEIFQTIKKEINYLCKPSLIKQDSLCHGSLQPSNILFREGQFKLIDFNKSYLANRYLDLSRLAIFLGLTSFEEKNMLLEYLSSQKKEFNQQEWEEYRSCYDIMIRIVFIELISTYLKEVYVFSSFRPAKILNVIDVFVKNNKAFFRLPIINKHYEFIYKIMLESIIGQKESQ